MQIGFDTSCYTTSIAAVSEQGIILDKRIMLDVEEGKRGLRQSEAVFLHMRNLSEMLGEIDLSKGTSVSVSARPRNVRGSYMPVFTAGVCAAKAVSSALGCRLNEFSHQQGHIMAGLLSANLIEWRHEPFLAFHISGGTTEMLLVEGKNFENIKIIGKTLDIPAGQLIDRVGVKLGLKFPCGKELEKLAENKTDIITLPVSVNGTEINFSGAETQAMRLDATAENIAAAVLDCVARTVLKVIENAQNMYNIQRVLVVGGVAANKQIREHVKNAAIFASPGLSGDNAVGIACLGGCV
jgi:N6-L-threonylcarbamoyladenine synthase